jgi:hypothetical protein
MGILILLNILLYFFDSEDAARFYFFIISLTLLVIGIISIIFYPKFMGVKFHLLRYNDYLYDAISAYQKSLAIIKKRISIAEEADIKQFIIGKTKPSKYDPERKKKLFEEARVNKDRILADYQTEKEKIEKQLAFYQEERTECSELLMAYGEPSHTH